MNCDPNYMEMAMFVSKAEAHHWEAWAGNIRRSCKHSTKIVKVYVIVQCICDSTYCFVAPLGLL
jgi:hypothetical protein